MKQPETFGLTHLGILSNDPERAAAFYGAAFGCRVTWRGGDAVQVETPGAKDVLVFERAPPSRKRNVGRVAGVTHFGFRLRRSNDLDEVLKRVQAAGGRVRERGHFSPGEPYAFVLDPDGYEVEIWFEPSRRQAKNRP